MAMSRTFAGPGVCPGAGPWGRVAGGTRTTEARMAEQAQPGSQSNAGDVGQWIITAVGPDRPGLVGDLTGHLHAAGANLLDSRMVNLRGQFALVLLMEDPAVPGEAL